MPRKLVSLLASATLIAGLGLAGAPAQAATPNAAANVIGKPVPHLLSKGPAGVKGLKGLPKQGPTTRSACGTCYYYAGGKQTATSDGASVLVDIVKPVIAANGFHSLAELAVESANFQQVVEVGWNVDPALYGDNNPHAFVFKWVNGTAGCYNGCGWVGAMGAATTAGQSLAADIGTIKSFAIQHLTNAQCGCTAGWWVAYNGAWMGAFPDTLWTSPTYTQAGFHQVFGEVALSDTTSTTDMGDPSVSLASATVGARLNSYAMVNSGSANSLTLFATDAARWSVFYSPTTSVRSIRYGGQG